MWVPQQGCKPFDHKSSNHVQIGNVKVCEHAKKASDCLIIHTWCHVNISGCFPWPCSSCFIWYDIGCLWLTMAWEIRKSLSVSVIPSITCPNLIQVYVCSLHTCFLPYFIPLAVELNLLQHFIPLTTQSFTECMCIHRRRSWSGWSGFGRTTLLAI